MTKYLSRRRRLTLSSQAKHDACVRADPCYVQHLPLELLELVFGFVREIDPPHSYPGYMYPGWLRVLSVCSWWRTAATNCPRLWDVVPGTDLTPSWVFRMVTYSKHIPLGLSVNSSKLARGNPKQSLSRLLDTVAHRLNHLHLVIDSDAEEVAAALREAPAASGLHSLSITANSAAVLLPTDVFSHDTAQLRRLTLVDCFIPWGASLYAQLEHLSIHLTPHAARTIGFAEVQDNACSRGAYEALQRLAPTLRTLSLRDVQPFTSDAAHEPIDLPNLDHLTLEGSTSDCITIMHSLSFPSTTNISLYLSSDDSAALVNTMRILDIASVPVRALELDFDHESAYQFTMRLHSTTPRGERTHTLYVNRTAYSSRWAACCEYAPIVRSLRLHETTTLIHRASNWRFWAADTWRSIQLPNLRTVVAVGIPASISLLDALAGKSMLAPELEHLRVARVPPGYAFFSHRPEVLSLEQFKQLREDAGCSVPEVATV
ncbi:hypothetical protein PENSPDRAFT_171276 [Peniophora sp. CONT]|nr:hypothetical protein PENSPDRAFT_171276 [Peniophora sp. CONT]